MSYRPVHYMHNLYGLSIPNEATPAQGHIPAGKPVVTHLTNTNISHLVREKNVFVQRTMPL
jgi:hypothetical protein